MEEGFIYTRSCTCASFVAYCTSAEAKIVENETGLRLFAFRRNDQNSEIYNKYKNAVANGDKLFVDLVKYNKILKYLKNLSRNYKR